MAPKAISYRVKEGIACPVCSFDYRREKLHSGGGRLIAADLTNELRRLYQVSKKFGRVYPLAYEVCTCPQCLYSAYEIDYKNLATDELQEIKAASQDRRMQIEKILGPLDFNEDRNLVLGAASYLLAIDCYQKRGIEVAPTPKKAISSMRAAWLIGDLEDEFPGKGFAKVQDLLYMKAVTYYSPMLEIMGTGSEAHEKFIKLLGPDTDKNWGFDGVIYLNGYLSNKYLARITNSEEQRIAVLERNKQHLGKLYGAGRSSSSKPSVIINLAKDLYEDISKQLDQLKGVEQEAE